MTELALYYATNRGHEGTDRWRPVRYGTQFSTDGLENLRFGKVTVEVPLRELQERLRAASGIGPGDGEGLAARLAQAAARGRITPYREEIDRSRSERLQPEAKLGSQAMFADLQRDMQSSCDVLVYIHGYNVAWEDAVGSALALQCMLNRHDDHEDDDDEGAHARHAHRTLVVLFSWPSNGQMIPWVSYRSDRTEAEGSGYAFARGLLKMREFLAGLAADRLCRQDLHLLCHSMGNYVLQHALARLRDFTPGTVFPRLFEHVFLCAADVDSDALEPDNPLGDLHQLARTIDVYHNRGDAALRISDYTKGNPDRLGSFGAARAGMLPDKVHQLDCSDIVGGLVEHSYYLAGRVNDDIWQSVQGRTADDARRQRTRVHGAGNRWRIF